MEFLINRSKLIHIIYGVICFVLLLSAIVFMTQYVHVRVLTTVSTTGVVELSSGNLNKNFIDFYSLNNLGDPTADMWKIYNFKQDLNNFNNLILYFGVTALVLFLVLMIVGNQSRKVYYMSNLVVGVAVPGIIAILNLVLICLNSGFYGKFNEGKDLYNMASLLVEEKKGIVYSQYQLDRLKPLFKCDTLTFTLYNVLFAIILVVSLAMVAYAIYRFINSSEKRKEIIARAVSQNE